MDIKLGRKPHRERRNEARKEKKSRKHLATTGLQELHELKKQKFHEHKGDSGVPRSKNAKKAKRKRAGKETSRTKFEEYVEMDMRRDAVPQDDLKFERDLARKLNAKDGLLTGFDDNINSLLMDSDADSQNLEGENSPSVNTDSDLESLEEEEIQEDAGDSRKMFDDHSLSSKSTKRKSPGQELSRELKSKKERTSLDQEQEGAVKVKKRDLLGEELDGEVAGEESSPIEILHVEGASGNIANVPAFEGNAKYVAPRLRARAVDNVEYVQIRRQVRGLLNRLSESNVESITGQICSVFRSVSRSVGSEIVSEEILASCSGGPRGNEQYAAVFAAFVAGMACSVGMDFSAKLIASLAKCFEDEYAKEDNLSLRNLTLLLCYLCIFGVCSSDLIYDFLIMLSKRLTEVDVSTILTILQCCGLKLRGDDPTAMKNFIFSVQNRVNELKSSSDGPTNQNNKRMEFMLETICDIKNNKKRSKEEPAQHTRIKKWLQKLRVEDILIRGVTWSKLLDPNKRGQWWFSGDMASARDNVEEVASTIDKEVLEAGKMLQLAAEQRMNTDTRRAIFCIIMSGEDYVDAFEKLLRLDLQGKQDREIMRVLVECCLQEKVFNKYYTVLASKLCGYDKRHKFTLQYCLWDHFKELESMPLQRLMHLSRFVAEMLSSYSLSLSALKAVDLTDAGQLTPKRIMHFRMLFEALFEYSDKLVWNIFTRIAVAPDLESLRDSIDFFVSRYVVGANKAISGKFKVAKKALNNVEGVLM